jgi:hypothetical protein
MEAAGGPHSQTRRGRPLVEARRAEGVYGRLAWLDHRAVL